MKNPLETHKGYIEMLREQRKNGKPLPGLLEIIADLAEALKEREDLANDNEAHFTSVVHELASVQAKLKEHMEAVANRDVLIDSLKHDLSVVARSREILREANELRKKHLDEKEQEIHRLKTELAALRDNPNNPLM